VPIDKAGILGRISRLRKRGDMTTIKSFGRFEVESSNVRAVVQEQFVVSVPEKLGNATVRGLYCIQISGRIK
jgi:hypothetical protein